MGAHEGSCLASAKLPGSCTGPGGPGAQLDGATCELGEAGDCPEAGAPARPPVSTRTSLGKGSRNYPHATPLPGFPALSTAKPELPEVWVAALVGGDGDMPCALFCPLFPPDRGYSRALPAHL